MLEAGSLVAFPRVDAVAAKLARSLTARLVAAAGMALLLGAIIAHRKAADGGKETAPAWLALLLTLAYLAIAVTG